MPSRPHGVPSRRMGGPHPGSDRARMAPCRPRDATSVVAPAVVSRGAFLRQPEPRCCFAERCNVATGTQHREVRPYQCGSLAVLQPRDQGRASSTSSTSVPRHASRARCSGESRTPDTNTNPPRVTSSYRTSSDRSAFGHSRPLRDLPGLRPSTSSDRRSGGVSLSRRRSRRPGTQCSRGRWPCGAGHRPCRPASWRHR